MGGIKLHSKKLFLDQQFKENQKTLFAKRLNEALQKRKTKETLDSLAELFEVERTTVNNWKHGRCLPKQATRRSVARKLNLHENYFEPDYTLEDQDLADARYHWKMDQHYAGYADEIGLDEDFVRFIRNNELFSDMISNLQHIDVLLNSMDPRVPKTQSAFQFTTKVGERFYINEYMIYILRALQGEVEDYIHSLLFKYEQILDEEERIRKNKDMDWIEYYEIGWFARRVKYLEGERLRKKTMF